MEPERIAAEGGFLDFVETKVNDRMYSAEEGYLDVLAYARDCDRELATLAAEATRLRTERDRETELRRQAEKWAQDMKASYEAIPYSDEWPEVKRQLEAAEAEATRLREAAQGVLDDIDYMEFPHTGHWASKLRAALEARNDA